MPTGIGIAAGACTRSQIEAPRRQPLRQVDHQGAGGVAQGRRRHRRSRAGSARRVPAPRPRPGSGTATAAPVAVGLRCRSRGRRGCATKWAACCARTGSRHGRHRQTRHRGAPPPPPAPAGRRPAVAATLPAPAPTRPSPGTATGSTNGTGASIDGFQVGWASSVAQAATTFVSNSHPHHTSRHTGLHAQIHAAVPRGAGDRCSPKARSTPALLAIGAIAHRRT